MRLSVARSFRCVAAPLGAAVVCLAACGFAATTLAAPPAAAAPPPLQKAPPARADVSYGPHPHQLLDLYVPPEGGPHPVLIWYGGLWKPAKHAPDRNRFFKAGCAVVAVQTRVMQDAIDAKIEPPVSVCLLDACRAVQTVRLHAADWNLDPQRIVVGGGSQGSLPALYLGCARDRADPKSADPVERVSTHVLGVGAYRSQPSIDPRRMQEWVPGVKWGAPALGCSFEASLEKRETLLPWIEAWSPEQLLHKNAAPLYFEYNWGLEQPQEVERMDYLVHAPQWALGFQKMAEAKGATCLVKYPGHPTETYADLWDFLIQRMTAADR